MKHTGFNTDEEPLELAYEFIQNRTDKCSKNLFKVEWVKGDTTETINKLKDGKVDIGITYNMAAELDAIQNGIAHGCNQSLACENCEHRKKEANKEFCGARCACCNHKNDNPCYIFRDHFYLVGPPENLPGPHKLKPEDDDISSMFSKIYFAAENANNNDTVRFLSRYDKSATNIKESEVWINIGQVSLSLL